MKYTVWFGPISGESEIVLEADSFKVTDTGDLVLYNGLREVAAFSNKTWTVIIEGTELRPIRPEKPTIPTPPTTPTTTLKSRKPPPWVKKRI